MADDCDNQFGGRISINLGGTLFAPTEADITLEPSNISTEAKANQDGSACFMAKPKLFKADIKFRNSSGIVWNDVIRTCKLDVTISEIDNNRTHLFTGARITGDPKVNLSDGSVDGMTIEGSQYQFIAG